MDNGEFINKMRVVAVSGMAAEQLAVDVWKEMVEVLTENEDKGVDKIKELCVDMEAAFKVDYSITAMPAAYRSAKSVAITALKNGVKLMDEGAVRGKTAVEADIRTARTVAGVVDSAKGGLTPPLSDSDKLEVWIDKAYFLFHSGVRPHNIAGTKAKLEWMFEQL